VTTEGLSESYATVEYSDTSFT